MREGTVPSSVAVVAVALDLNVGAFESPNTVLAPVVVRRYEASDHLGRAAFVLLIRVPTGPTGPKGEEA